MNKYDKISPTSQKSLICLPCKTVQEAMAVIHKPGQNVRRMP